MRDSDWIALAPTLNGEAFERFQRELCRRNGARLEPLTPSGDWRDDVHARAALAEAEIAYVESARAAIAPFVADIPSDADAFLAWYERLAENGTRPERSAVPLARATGELRGYEMVS